MFPAGITAFNARSAHPAAAASGKQLFLNGNRPGAAKKN